MRFAVAFLPFDDQGREVVALMLSACNTSMLMDSLASPLPTTRALRPRGHG